MKLRLPSKLVAAILAAASPVLLQTLSTATLGAAAFTLSVSQASANQWGLNGSYMESYYFDTDGTVEVITTADSTATNNYIRAGEGGTRVATVGALTVTNGHSLTVADWGSGKFSPLTINNLIAEEGAGAFTVNANQTVIVNDAEGSFSQINSSGTTTFNTALTTSAFNAYAGTTTFSKDTAVSGQLQIGNGNTAATVNVTGGTLTANVIYFRNSGSKLNIGSGAVVNATTAFQNSWGYSNVVVDGVLNTAWLWMTSGTTNVLTGEGVINADKVSFENAGIYKFSGIRLNVGANGIVNGRPATMSDMTLGAMSDWTLSASDVRFGGAIVLDTAHWDKMSNTANTGQGHTITINNSFNEMTDTPLTSLTIAGDGRVVLKQTANISHANVVLSGGTLELQQGGTIGSVSGEGGNLVLGNNSALALLNGAISLGSGSLTVGSGVRINMAPAVFSEAVVGQYGFSEDDGQGHRDGYVIGNFRLATADSIILQGQPSEGTLTVEDYAGGGKELILSLDGSEGGFYMANWNVDYATGSKVTRGNHNAYGASRIYLTTPLNAETGQQSVLNLKSALQSGVDIVSNGGVLNLGDGITLNSSSLSTVGTEKTTINSNGSTSALLISGTHTPQDTIFTKLKGDVNVVVNAATTLSDGVSPTLTGALTVSNNAVLSVGAKDDQTNSLSSFTAVTLDNGTIKYNNKKDTLHDVSVSAGKTGKIASTDMGNANGDKLLLSGVTCVDGTLTISNYWNAQFEIENMAGSGTLNVTGMTGENNLSDSSNSNQAATYTINSLTGFTGTLSVDNSKASVTVNTGSGAVDFSALTVTHSTTDNDAGVTLNAQDTTQIGAVSIGSGSLLTLGGTGVITLTSAIQNAGILKLADNAKINLNAEASGELLGYGTVDSYTENGNGYAIASGVSATLVNAAENSTFTQGTGVTYTLNGAAATLVDNRLSLGEGNNRLSNTYHVNTTETFDGVPSDYADMTGLNVKASQAFTLTNGSLSLRDVTVAAGGSVTVGDGGKLSLESAAFASDATLTTSAGKTTLLGAATVNYIINSATGDAANVGLFIGEGGVLTLNEKGSGQSYIRGNITVQDGGTLVLRHDSTGYSGGANAVNKITVNAGGKLQLGMNNSNDTFRGTLVLNGLLETAPTNSGAWMDLYQTAQVLVSDNEHGVVSANTYFKLRNNNTNTQFNIGTDATLTMNGRIIKTGTTEGNNSIKKLGAGEMILNNTTDLNAVALAGGKLTFNDTTTLTQITTDSNTTSTIAGSGSIAVAGTSSAAALSVGAGVTLNLEADNLTLRNSDFSGRGDTDRKLSLAITGENSTLNINSGVTTVYGATYTGGGAKKVTLNIGTGSKEAILVTTRLEMGDSGGGSTELTADNHHYLNVGAHGKLVVTGTNNEYGEAKAQQTAFVMSEWNTSVVAYVDGKLYGRDAVLSSNDYPLFLTVRDGGILAVKGLESNRDKSTAAFNLTLQDGGNLILGEDGLKGTRTATTWNINLAGGEIGMTADMEMKRDMTLQSGTTTTFNTAKYTWRGEGADQEVVSGTEGGTMTVSGGLSGSGSLTKKGLGTLVLSGVVNITGAATVNAGELTLSGAGAKNFGSMSINNGATLNIGTGVVSTVSGSSSISGKVTGAGTLIFDGSLPTIGNGAVAFSDETAWLGTTVLKPSAAITELNITRYGNANSAVQLVGVSGWCSSSAWDFAGKLILGNESGESVAAMTYTNGHSSTTYTYSGSVVGTGNLVHNATVTINNKFTGDISGWTGTYSNSNSGTSSITLEGVAKTVNARFQRANGTLNITAKTDTTFNATLNISTLTANSSNVTINGGEHTIDNIYADDYNNAADTIRLTDNATVTVSGAIQVGAQGGSYVVEQGSALKLTSHGFRVEAAQGAEAATISSLFTATSGGHYTYDKASSAFAISDAKITAAYASAATISTKLENSTIINNAAGALTVNHNASTLKGVDAKVGDVIVQNASSSKDSLDSIKATGADVTLQQLGTNASLSLTELVIGDSKTVSALTDDQTHVNGGANVATVTIENNGVLKAGNNSTLNANLVMERGSTLGMGDSGLQLGCSLTLNQETNLSTEDGTYDSVLNTGYDTRWLYTSVDSLTLVGTDGAVLNSTMTAEQQAAAMVLINQVDASTYFNNLTQGVYFMTVQTNSNGGWDLGVTAPEPTTSVLSLLALAGMAARRRRK